MPKHRLPPGSRLIIRILVPGHLRDEVEGDLAERFSDVERSEGRRSARRWLMWQLRTLRPLALRRGGSRGGGHSTSGTPTGAKGMDKGWGADLRQALRTLRRRPAASMTVVVTVALAIGATTSVYSVVDGVLLRPLPYPQPEQLVRVWQTRPDWAESPNSQLRAFADRFPLSVPTFNDWTQASMGFQAIGAYSGARYVLQGADGAELLDGQAVTSGFFEVLQIDPIIGRYLLPADDRIGAPRVVVLSGRFWQNRFGGGDVLGTDLTLDGVAHTVVGVMPIGFHGPGGDAGLWTSLTDEDKADERDTQYLNVVARLENGVTMGTAAERVGAVQVGLTEAYPDTQGELGARLQGLLDAVVGGVHATLWFLLGAVTLVLIVATINIANILTVMGLTRRSEMALRAALGAGSGRLMRGLFVECAVLAALGGLAGIVVAWASLPILLRLVPSSVPRSDLIGVSPGVLLFGIGATALTTLLVGILPAFQASRTHPSEMMRSSSRSATCGRRGGRLRAAMVVVEVALAFVLLVGAALLGGSFARLWSVDRGFATEGLVAMRVTPDPAEYPDRDARDRFVRELGERLAAIPGVRVSATNQVPLSGSNSTTTYSAERLDREPEEANVIISVGLPNYLSLMEIPLLSGRGFASTDARDGPHVGIVNEAMAQSLWPGESALGKRLRPNEESPWVEVIGVAANVQHQGLAIEVEPKLYVPAPQNRRSITSWVLRIEGDVAAASDLARQAVASLSPTTPVRSVQILEKTISDSVAVPRFRTLFVAGLAGLAAVLALLGVYGVVTFSVTQRTREIGVRMALGARSTGVVRDVLGSGLRLALAGVGAGLVIAWPAGRMIDDFLFGIAPTDPLTYVAIALAVTAVSGLAAYLPARRAAHVDPIKVLSSD